MAHDVFISYASSDKAVADAVCSQLESIHRIRCWIAPRDVTPGASWAESIIDALDGSKIMVLIFSSSANASMQIEREVERAVHKGINIIPLRIENAMPTKTLEYFISAPHWLDALTTPLEDHINKLAQSVKALLSKHGTHAPQPDSVKAAIAPPVRVQPAAAAAEAVKANPRQSWMIPAAVSAVIVAAAFVLGSRFMGSGQPAPAASPVQPAAQPPAAPATMPPSTSPAAATPAPVPDAEKTSAPGAATPSGTPQAATAAAAAIVAPKTEPNLFVDFRNTIEEGTMTLEIDGQTRWTTKLGGGLKPDGKDNPRFEDLRTSLNIPTGRHKVTATLKTPDGKVRDTDSTSITIPETAPRTLRIRLSRFRHHVEFQEVAGRQIPVEKPTVSTQKSAASATAKPAAAQAKAAPPPGKPAPASK